jgi:nitrite reductase/ring-hydroxylating ferredoxin subunit
VTQGVVKQIGPAGEVLVAETSAGVRAYLNICPHQSAPLDGGTGNFQRKGDHLACVHHQAIFDLTTGVCIWGPCVGRSLTPVPLDQLDDRAG